MKLTQETIEKIYNLRINQYKNEYIFTYAGIDFYLNAENYDFGLLNDRYSMKELYLNRYDDFKMMIYKKEVFKKQPAFKGFGLLSFIKKEFIYEWYWGKYELEFLISEFQLRYLNMLEKESKEKEIKQIKKERALEKLGLTLEEFELLIEDIKK